MAEIEIRNLRKKFGDFTAVHSSSFRIEDGEFFMLLGPSGCGKTTTLRMIAGLELPTSGEIRIGGEEVGQKPASQRDIAFVFQMFALYPHLNVRRNIAYPLVSQGMPRAQVREKVAEVARILGIEGMLDKPVGGLSGGDRQRVALGRAIVRDPKCFLMDEPLGALDAEFRERMAEELRALHDRMGATTVYVTHDQLEAMQMGDKIVVMNAGRRGTVRRAAGYLRQARDHVRGRIHRRAADEFPALSRHGRDGRHHRHPASPGAAGPGTARALRRRHGLWRAARTCPHHRCGRLSRRGDRRPNIWAPRRS